jgi:hypothetical protein
MGRIQATDGASRNRVPSDVVSAVLAPLDEKMVHVPRGSEKFCGCCKFIF